MKKLLFVVLFLAAFLERTAFDLGPNIELVTLAMLVSAAYSGKKQSFWLTFLIMASTDLVLGNTNIFIFTWSGFLVPALISADIFSRYKNKGVKKIFQGTLVGAGANFFFFLWTNFGVWLLDTWGMYPKTAQGLMMSYVSGLPFWKNQLISTLVFVTAGFAAVEAVIYLAKKYNLQPRLSKQELV